MTEFDDIRPYNDDEVAPAIARLLDDPEFKRVVHYVYPNINWLQFELTMRSFQTIYDFQTAIIINIINYLLKKTSDSVDCTGHENIEKGGAYTFISNHRDIVLDASILCVLLENHGYSTVEIAIGDNLLIHPWINDIVRLNKSFIVKRGVSIRQMLEASKHLSAYMHHAITQKKQSIWIAQREGRAKDSNDKTQESLLKMFSLGNDAGFIESIRQLNITPLSISYEYDPCDYLKAKEFQLKRDNPEHKKSPHDDLLNMETGIYGFKGNIHFQIGRPINPFLDQIEATAQDKNETITAVAALIDREIYLNYKFFPVNYIAYDRLWGDNQTFSSLYSANDIENFDVYLQKKLDLITIPDKDIAFLTEKILEMYAYPVKNQLAAKTWQETNGI